MIKQATLIIGILLSWVVCAQAQTPRIDLFEAGNAGFRMSADTVATHHDLNALIELEQVTSKGLSSNKAIAQQQVSERLNSELRKRIIAASEPHIVAHRLQIKFIPAVVIGRQYVYYGRDVNKALELWRSFHAQS